MRSRFAHDLSSTVSHLQMLTACSMAWLLMPFGSNVWVTAMSVSPRTQMTRPFCRYHTHGSMRTPRSTCWNHCERFASRMMVALIE